MAARHLLPLLLGISSCVALDVQERDSNGIKLCAELSEQVRQLDDLSERISKRLGEPFTQRFGPDGEALDKDVLPPFVDLSESMMLGTQGAKLIEVVTTGHFHFKCAADRRQIDSIASREFDYSVAIVWHAMAHIENRAAILGADSVEGKLGVDAAEALRNVYLISTQLKATAFPEAAEHGSSDES